jgi:hypothetical protein
MIYCNMRIYKNIFHGRDDVEVIGQHGGRRKCPKARNNPQVIDVKKYCTKCLMKTEKPGQCSQCNKTLGAEFICVKIKSASAHFCSKKCSDTVAVAASYRPVEPESTEPPQGYECKKCGYKLVPENFEMQPKLCPECASPDPWRPS